MKRILIIKTGALGDIVRTTYILPGIAKKYGEVCIHWVVKKPGEELIRCNPYIDKFFDIETLQGLSSYYDLVISLDDEIKSASITNMVRFERVVGLFLEHGKLKYTSDSDLWFDMGLLSKFGKQKADILKKKNTMSHTEIFEKILDIDIRLPYFNNDLDALRLAELEYSSVAFNIGINPCAGERWPSKELSTVEFRNLLNVLTSERATAINSRNIIVNLYGINDRDEYNEVAKSFNHNVIMRDTSSSLQVFAAHIKQCDYFISSDSLALHLAISQGVPSCSFYSPTSSAEIDTFDSGVKVVSLDDDYCSYMPDAKNTSITSERIYNEMITHIAKV